MALIVPFRGGGGIQKFVIAFALSVMSLMTGVTGYYVIGRFTLTDAFYMTVITLSAVGFKEVHPRPRVGIQP